jgi:hypothetical protein
MPRDQPQPTAVESSIVVWLAAVWSQALDNFNGEQLAYIAAMASGSQLAYIAAMASGSQLLFGDRPKHITYRWVFEGSGVGFSARLSHH